MKVKPMTLMFDEAAVNATRHPLIRRIRQTFYMRGMEHDEFVRLFNDYSQRVGHSYDTTNTNRNNILKALGRDDDMTFRFFVFIVKEVLNQDDESFEAILRFGDIGPDAAVIEYASLEVLLGIAAEYAEIVSRQATIQIAAERSRRPATRDTVRLGKYLKLQLNAETLHNATPTIPHDVVVWWETATGKKRDVGATKPSHVSIDPDVLKILIENASQNTERLREQSHGISAETGHSAYMEHRGRVNAADVALTQARSLLSEIQPTDQPTPPVADNTQAPELDPATKRALDIEGQFGSAV